MQPIIAAYGLYLGVDRVVQEVILERDGGVRFEDVLASYEEVTKRGLDINLTGSGIRVLRPVDRVYVLRNWLSADTLW